MSAPEFNPIERACRDALREIAAGATPGPWSGPADQSDVHVYGPDGDSILAAHWVAAPDSGDMTTNAAYLAALSPEVVIALLDRLDALEAEENEARSVLLARISELEAARRLCEECSEDDDEHLRN